jgi:hypothetical protein
MLSMSAGKVDASIISPLFGKAQYQGHVQNSRFGHRLRSTSGFNNHISSRRSTTLSALSEPPILPISSSNTDIMGGGGEKAPGQ